MQLCLAAAVAVAALLLGPTLTHATEINSAVSIFGPWDYELRADGTSRCTDMVKRTAELGVNSRTMFLPTLFWVSKHPEDFFETNSVDAEEYFDDQREVEYFCFNQQYHRAPKQAGVRHIITGFFLGAGASTAGEVREGRAASWQATQHRNRLQVCPQATKEDIASFQQAMGVCFKAAVDARLSIAVSPRLDDGCGLGGWRNGLLFDPFKKYGEWSYMDIMVQPLIEALRSAMTEDTKVWFSLQGEMSATVMYYPQKYLEMMDVVRAALLEGRPASWGPNLKIGLQMNYNKLCACVEEDAIHPEFENSLAKVIDQFDLPAIKAVFEATEFIGMSSYPSLNAVFRESDLENALWQFARELKFFGVSLEKLALTQGKEIHWTEYGVGGGTCHTGNCLAETASQAAHYPFFGIWGPYRAEMDPWQLNDKDISGPRSYLHYFYNQTAHYLANQRWRYRVDGCFLWSTGSWDVLAVYPESTSTEGSYFDPVVANIIATHNKKAREDGHAFLAPSRVAKKKFSSGIDTSMTIRIEKPQNNMERRLLSWRSTPQ